MVVDFTPDPELYPFESRWFDSSAGRVHYIDEGAGRPILFCHGNPTWSFLYRDIIVQLRGEFRCIAVDYPGFGLSDRPTDYGYTAAEHAAVVQALVASLDPKDLIVMGQDWGGPIGMATAVAHADRVTGLVFGNTWFWPHDDWKIRVFSAVMSSGFMQRRVLNKNEFVERFIPMGTAKKLSDAEMQHYRRVQPEGGRTGAAVFPRELRDAKPWLAELAAAVPSALGDRRTLLVWGDRDAAFPPKTFLPRWRETFPDHVLVHLPRAKHFIQEDAPDEIAAAIRRRFA